MSALDVDAVAAFVLVADLRSFTRAAEALDSTQSAVSVRIRRLEERLGRRLLDRTPRLVRLSADGAAFLEPARELVRAHARALDPQATEPTRLALGVTQHLAGPALPALLAQLRRDDPGLQVELRVGGSRELLQRYDDGALDAVLVAQQDRRRKGHGVLREPFGWLALPQLELSPGAPVPLATQGETCGVRAAALRSLRAAGRAWNEVFVGQGAAALGAAAAAGFAVAVMSRRSAPPECVDVGAKLGLPTLPAQRIVLYSAVTDARLTHAIGRVAAALR